ncbi:MAG: ABC transporter substrate-binding protein, partial [Candidatus Thorarchaeota archaeon]
FNPMITNSYYSKVILANMYDSLFRIGPDGERRLSLAESYFAENHDNNSEVPVGHLRFTFDIVQGATWTDGTPLTADDVAYTFSYLYESMAYGNPMGIPLVDLFSSTSPLPTRAVVEFSSESYWHISTFAELPIFQKTLLESLGYSGWNSWNPIFSPDPCPTSGPFNITNMQAGEYYELSYYPNYRNRVRGNGSDQPNVGGPSHFTAISGTIPNTISWNINDDNPLLYRLYNNGSLAEADYNTHSRVSININSHVTTYGLYNFTIQILDWEYQHAEHTVLVDFVPDTIDPVIEGPDDMNITAGDVGENIVWNVTDHNPSTYSILLNGAEEDTGSWNNGEPIVFNLSDLTVGDYNVTLIANDLMGHSNADTVLVSVHAPPGFVMDTMMLLGIAGVVGVIVVAVVVFKVKRAS